MKEIKIPEELFYMLIKYFMGNQEDLREDIEHQIRNKLDRIVQRELYTEFKKAESPEKREKARLLYLDNKGIPEDFRW